MRVVLALVTLLAACGIDGEDPDAPSALEGSWMLDVLDGANADPAVDAQLTLDGGPAAGNGGVNTFTGTYKAPDVEELTFCPLASTKKAGPDDAMQQERAFLTALANTRRFTTEDSTLQLLDDGGKTLAMLKLTGEG